MPSPEAATLRFYQRFPFRITLLYAIPVYFILFLIALTNTQRGIAVELESLQARLHAMTITLATRIPAATGSRDTWTADDREAMRVVFAELGHDEPDVSSIYVVRPTDDPLTVEYAVDWVSEGDDAATLNQPYDATQAPMMLATFEHGPQVEQEVYTDEWGPTLSGYAPILDANGKAVAIVGCDIAAARIDELKTQVLWSSLAMFGLAFVAIAVVGLIVAWNVRVPLDRMVAMMNRIGGGDLEGRVVLDRADEFGVLAHHLDRMAEGLQEREYIRGIFGRYVSEGVARAVLDTKDGANLGGEERVVTVLFGDIRSYATISERLGPGQVVAMLNDYMGAMGEIVDAEGGVVIEFLGDAILAVFGAPQHDEHHAEKAVAAARKMDARLTELNRDWEKTGLAKLWKDAGIDELSLRIGIHTGRVVAGNMGGVARVKYAVIGDAVNVASRVEGLNNLLGTRILATQATIDALSPEAKRDAFPKGEHPLKGREQTVNVYTFP
jgi:adenylate cyclase